MPVSRICYWDNTQVNQMYVIKWRSKTTGKTGCGEPILDINSARDMCDIMNKRYPDVEHRYESDGD